MRLYGKAQLARGAITTNSDADVRPAFMGPLTPDGERAVEQINETLDSSGLDREAKIRVLKGADLMLKRDELVKELDSANRRLQAVRGELRGSETNLDAALKDAGLMDLVHEIERRAKLLLVPPANSAANIETRLMSYAYWIFGYKTDGIERPGADVVLALKGAALRTPLVADLVERFRSFVDGGETTDEFARLWLAASFARLELGHKLAASLCLTDVPDDVEVRAPWEAWSLVIPDGLFPGVFSGSRELSRVWLLGTETIFVMHRDGHAAVIPKDKSDGADELRGMLKALIRGACLALSNPDDFRKEKQHAPTARAQHKTSRHGPPDMQQARFMLSAPVKVDLREHLAAALSGRKGASPTVQFLVRGHWRNQTHGPKHSLRKTIWIQPFWKGPEESRILLRQHRVEEPSP